MAAMNVRILVVEDDPAIRRGLVDALKFSGYEVVEAVDGAGAIARLEEDVIDLVMLDVMLPGGMDGFGILEEVRRRRPALPVIMVTARGAEADRVRGLTRGADDYVVKPFGAMEVLARVEAVLRRSPGRRDSVERLSWNGCEVDLRRREVRHNGSSEPVSLSDKEAAILSYLALNRDRTVERAELLRQVWGLDPKGIETRTVDMHVARLREKLQHETERRRDGATTCREVIETVRGKGYKLGDGVLVGAGDGGHEKRRDGEKKRRREQDGHECTPGLERRHERGGP